MIKTKEKNIDEKIDCVKIQREIRTRLHKRWENNHKLMTKDLKKAQKNMETLFKK